MPIHWKLLSISILAAGAVIGLPLATDGAEKSKAVPAASAILGAMEEVTAFFNRCREVDPTNAEIYDGLSFQRILDKDNVAIRERIDMLLREEATRDGLPPTFYRATLYPILKETLQSTTHATEATDPAKFLATCQLQPQMARQHSGYFAPLRQRFPAEMRLIDEWK
jgi:type II secretory pathway pseudopilin PulG